MENTHILINNISDIPEMEGEGYLWMSDENNPEIISNSKALRKESINPYIVEAMFYSPKSEKSIMIKSDGCKPIITLTNWQTASDNGVVLEETNYIPHKITIGKITLIQAWEETKDPNCNDWPVLKPTWKAFKGFEKPNNKEN